MEKDYKKLYEDALERAKKIQAEYKELFGDEYSGEDIVDIFPELAESEDEKIRKAIIEFIHDTPSDEVENYSINKTDMLAWLEKQGGITKLSEDEQNRFAKGVLSGCATSFIKYLEAHKYEGKMCVSNGECEDIENAFHNAMWDRLHRYYCKYIEKQGEQKTTWSEEDERILSKIQDHLRVFYVYKKGYPYVAELDSHEMIEGNWLKSIKERMKGE